MALQGASSWSRKLAPSAYIRLASFFKNGMVSFCCRGSFSCGSHIPVFVFAHGVAMFSLGAVFLALVVFDCVVPECLVPPVLFVLCYLVFHSLSHFRYYC